MTLSFLTNSMTIPGLGNKNHFPWLFQAAGTLKEESNPLLKAHGQCTHLAQCLGLIPLCSSIVVVVVVDVTFLLLCCGQGSLFLHKQVCSTFPTCLHLPFLQTWGERRWTKNLAERFTNMRPRCGLNPQRSDLSFIQKLMRFTAPQKEMVVKSPFCTFTVGAPASKFGGAKGARENFRKVKICYFCHVYAETIRFGLILTHL